VATRKSRATDYYATIFGGFLDEDLQIYLLINERGRYNRFRTGEMSVPYDTKKGTTQLFKVEFIPKIQGEG